MCGYNPWLAKNGLTLVASETILFAVNSAVYSKLA